MIDLIQVVLIIVLFYQTHTIGKILEKNANIIQMLIDELDNLDPK